MEQITTAFVIFLFLYQVLQILVSRNTLQFILDNLFVFLFDKIQEKLNDMMRRDDELDKDEAMKKCEIGKFGKIQQKVNKKFGNVEIKAYFCALNKYITLKIRRLWQ